MTAEERQRRALALVDAWESLRREVLARAPGCAGALAERLALDWRNAPPRDRGAIALAAALDIDTATPAGRRQARAWFRELEAEAKAAAGEPWPDAVREAPPPGWGSLDAAKRDAVRRDAERAMSPALLDAIAAAPGPVAAIDAVENGAALLKGLRAAAFLAGIGYPAAVADKPRRRWLHRFGLVEGAGESRAHRAEAQRALADIASHSGVDLREIDFLLAIFSGASPEWRDAALCAAKPRCPECPVRGACHFGRFTETHNIAAHEGPPRRNLADAILPEDRPREKLAQRGAETLSDAELVAILLRTGNGREHALDLANRILRDAGGLDRLAAQSVAEMTRTRGLGPVKAITVKAALELARRIARPRDPEGTVDNARAVFELLRGFFLGKKKEVFVCLMLNAKSRLIRQVVVSEGTVSQSLVHPREAFQEAIRESATAVIFAHNHPSGDPTPSREDHLVTKRLAKAGDIVGVRVLDHVVIGRDSYFSFADAGQMAPD